MRKALYIALLIVLGGTCTVTAQVVSTMPIGQPRAESFFLYEVKLIDEFIERFNDSKDCYLRAQCRTLYGSDAFITRPRMLRSLLNKKQSWTADTAGFFKAVMNDTQPVTLSFTDSNWYAELRCQMIYHGKKYDTHLVLHIVPLNGGFEWSIAGISNSTLVAGMPQTYAPTPSPSSGDYIPTSAYGTDFATLSILLTKGMHETDYIAPQLLAHPKAAYLADLIKKGEISVSSVKVLRYYFLQVPGYIFTVEQFKRKDTNSGWLINSLQKATNPEKQAFLDLLLYP